MSFFNFVKKSFYGCSEMNFYDHIWVEYSVDHVEFDIREKL